MLKIDIQMAMQTMQPSMICYYCDSVVGAAMVLFNFSDLNLHHLLDSVTFGHSLATNLIKSLISVPSVNMHKMSIFYP